MRKEDFTARLNSGNRHRHGASSHTVLRKLLDVCRPADREPVSVDDDHDRSVCQNDRPAAANTAFREAQQLTPWPALTPGFHPYNQEQKHERRSRGKERDDLRIVVAPPMRKQDEKQEQRRRTDR